MKILTRIADNTDPRSLASKMRERRFHLFHELLSRFHRAPLRILDVGGTPWFWENMKFAESNHYITILNLTEFQSSYPRIVSIAGDARSMPQFSDGQFDVVFSNSVIEHLFTYEQQQDMASEIRRVGKAYFVQTPNFYFPLEPHFLVPGFQWLPVPIRILLVQHVALGWYERKNSVADARNAVEEIRLLKYREMAQLFPDASIYRESLFGLTKSFIAIREK